MASDPLPPPNQQVHDQEMIKFSPEDEERRLQVVKRLKRIEKENGKEKVEIEMKIRELKCFGLITIYSDDSFQIPVSRKSKSSTFVEDEESLLPSKQQPISVGAFRYDRFTQQIEHHSIVRRIVRAVVIGPKGTPYHDGLFFFDIEVCRLGVLSIKYYCSHDSLDQIHPNIHRNGEFLSTWALSNVMYMFFDTVPTLTYPCRVLKVLHAIQVGYLNEEPYYAKLDDDNDGIDVSLHLDMKSSLGYNELTFLTNCKTMLALLSKPPPYFENFVAEHFVERSEAILKACKAYMNGTTHVGHGGSSSTHIDHPVSESFKVSLKQLYPKLVNAFEKNNMKKSSSLSFMKKFKIDYYLLMWYITGYITMCFGLLVIVVFTSPYVDRLIFGILSYVQLYFERLFIWIIDFFSTRN